MKTILEISSWKEIEAQFLSFLQMTENPCEFLMWNTATIAKVFTVADVIANTTNLHLPIPTALDCGYIKICFNKPIQTLLRSILASPYLSWFGAKFPIIFQQTLHQSSLRIGQNDTAVIACEILAMRLSTACNSNTSSMSHHYRRYQEEIMGFEHLHLIQKARCSNCALPLNFKNPISEVIDDMIKLRMVVIALALPPCGIACIFKSTQSSSHTSASCALQITDELSLSQLWDVLFQQASTAPSKILAIDPSFELIFQLIARNPLFCETFLRNLIVHPKFKSVESHVPFSIVTDKGVGEYLKVTVIDIIYSC